MAQRAERKEESRARILASAGRGFRARGFGGLGVDELAKQAGVTSGAFYAHFKSKAAAVREAIGAGMDDLRSGVQEMRRLAGDAWFPAFVDFYLGERRRAALPESCALQSLTGDVARADADARQVYEDKLREVLDAMTADDGAGRARAIAALALLSGAVSMARAVQDPALREEIAAAAREGARMLG
jgi:AcrR family transcriptional regulator